MLLAFGSACASSPSAPGPIAAAPQAAPTISFAEGRVGYGGRTIEFPAPIESVIGLFGPPSRTLDDGSTIDTWDELGVYTYRTPGESLVREVNVSLSVEGSAFSPHSRFIGRIELPGGTLDLDSTQADLEAAGLRRRIRALSSWDRNLGRFTVCAEWHDEVVNVWLAWRGPAPQHVTGPPLADGELFTARARDYEFPFDETLREVKRRGNVSVLEVIGASSQGSVGRSFFVGGALGELARRRGFAFFVTLNQGSTFGDDRDPDAGPGRIVVGFTNDEEPDVGREFPDDYVAGREYDTMSVDEILELMPGWPDGGKPADDGSGGESGR